MGDCQCSTPGGCSIKPSQGMGCWFISVATWTIDQLAVIIQYMLWANIYSLGYSGLGVWVFCGLLGPDPNTQNIWIRILLCNFCSFFKTYNFQNCWIYAAFYLNIQCNSARNVKNMQSFLLFFDSVPKNTEQDPDPARTFRIRPDPRHCCVVIFKLTVCFYLCCQCKYSLHCTTTKKKLYSLRHNNNYKKH